MHLNLQSLHRITQLELRASTASGARFDTDAGSLQVECYAPGILRLRLAAGPDALLPDYGLLATPPEVPPQVRFAADGGTYRLEAGALALDLAPDPVRLRLSHNGRTLLESVTDGHIRGGLRVPSMALDESDSRGPAWVIALALRAGEPIFGLGEKFGPLNRRGQLITSWNEDALGVNSERSYKNAPFAWSPHGWGVFVHTTSRVSHGVGYPQWSHRSYIMRTEDSVLDLFLFGAESPTGVLERYTHLTGRAPLPPRWSYGVWMSRCYYRTADEALAAARGLRERRIPCDVLTLDGRAWLKVETRFGFEWDVERYPDPEAFARELKDLNFRLCVWEYPYVSVHSPLFRYLAEMGYLLRNAVGDPYVYEWDPSPFGELLTPLPPSGMIDFTNPEAYAWYRDAHQHLFAQGVDVIKTDFGEQIPPDAFAANGDTGARLHNVYALLYNRCVYEATAQSTPGGALVWGRSGWTGSQRYPIQWGGDPQADWEGLAASVRGGLSWGASGAPFHSHDIGGFYHMTPGAIPDAELYVRWTQAGVMASHTRFHGTSAREPWYFGDEVEQIVRNWLEWRYRLIPYLEACALEAHRTGLPVMRAMPLVFPDDPASWAFEHQYMLGPSLLVAPVIEPGGRVRCYLPAGGWYDLEAGERFEGPHVIERTLRLDQMAVYGREGCLLPLGPVVQHTGELASQPAVMDVWVFGMPERGIEVPGARLDAADDGDVCRLRVPPGTTIRPFGGIRAEVSGECAILRPL